MFFKHVPRQASKLRIYIMVVFFLAGLLGCSGDDKSSNTIPKVTMAGADGPCLSQTVSTVERYLNGQMADAEIHAFFMCLQNSVATFEHYTQGADANSYTPQELRHFFLQTMMPNKTISDETLNQLMGFKQLLVSGSTTRITRDELKKLQQAAGVLEQTARAARTVVPILRQPASAEDLSRAMGDFRRAIFTAGIYLQENGNQAPVQTLVVLLQGAFGTSNWDAYLPLIQQLKKLVIGEPAETIEPNDWAPLLSFACSILEPYLIQKNFFQSGHWYDGEHFPLLTRQIDQLLNVAEDSVNRQPQQMWLDDDLVSLLLNGQNANLVSLHFPVEVLRQTEATLVHKVFKVADDPQNGLSFRHLALIKSEWALYKQSQLELMQKPTFQGLAPMRIDDNGLWVIDPLHPATWDLHSLSVVNVRRALMSRLFRVYGQDPVALQAAELTTLFSDFSQLLQNVAGTTPDAFSKRVLMEAAIFLPSSDGTSSFTLPLAIEYLNSLLSGYSGGSRASDLILNGTLQQGIPLASISHLPQLARLMTPDFWKNFEPLLEHAARSKSATGPLTAGDLVKMWILMQYIEIFYAKFDANHDSLIETNESLDAFKVYDSTIGSLLQGFDLGDGERKAFFTYLFNFGSTPFDDFAGALKFLHWTWEENQWSYQADRIRLAQILAKLSTF